LRRILDVSPWKRLVIAVGVAALAAGIAGAADPAAASPAAASSSVGPARASTPRKPPNPRKAPKPKPAPQWPSGSQNLGDDRYQPDETAINVNGVVYVPDWAGTFRRSGPATAMSSGGGWSRHTTASRARYRAAIPSWTGPRWSSARSWARTSSPSTPLPGPGSGSPGPTPIRRRRSPARRSSTRTWSTWAFPRARKPRRRTRTTSAAPSAAASSRSA
jgi:hypothetical protein